MDKTKYHYEKLAGRKTGYPIASVAYYGPNDQYASKVVVGILKNKTDKEVSELKKWFAKDQDVRLDKSILKEMVEYIDANQAHRIALVDRIIGCPHEEGIDYPEGEKCPQCPFWANRDRWTGEIIEESYP